MTKQDLTQLTNQKFHNLFDFLATHDASKWDKGPEGKWKSGQHIMHLIQSAKPLNKALGLPMFVLWYKFGKANRGPRSYDEVVGKYQTKVKEAGNVVSPFSNNMPDTPPESKTEIINKLKKEQSILLKKINRISESSLDKYLIPHPLMGRMLIREIIMWNAYHVEHHMKILQDKY